MTRLSSWVFGGLGFVALSNVGCGSRTGLLDGVGTRTHGAQSDGGKPDGDVGRDADDSDGGDDAGEGDATADDATTGDATLSDTGTGGDDGGGDDGGTETGTPFQPDERVRGPAPIVGVTDHGLIIYGDAAGSCWALAFSGGPPHLIMPAAAAGGPCAGGLHSTTTISHDVVFLTVGDQLYAWSAEGMAAPVLLPVGNASGAGAPSGIANGNSEFIAYGQGDLASGFSLINVSNVDGTNVQALQANALLFDGSTFTGALAVYSVEGSTSTSLSVLDLAVGSTVTLSSSSYGFTIDSIGKYTLYSADDGLMLTALDGSTQTLVDPEGGGGYLYLAPDASFAAYMGSLGFEAVTLPGGRPYAIAGLSTLNTVYPPSVRLQTPVGPVGAFEIVPNDDDIYALTILALTEGTPFVTEVFTNFRLANDYEDGDGFTADGAFALMLGFSAQSRTRFGAVPLTVGAAPIYLTEYGYDARALDGARVLYHDGYLSSGSLAYQGTADLRLANLARGTASVLVVPNVDAYVGISPDRTELAYTINRGTIDDGLYVTTLPTSP